LFHRASRAATVQFDNQLCLSTAKIDDVFVDRHLPLELQPVQTTIAHAEPQDALGVRLISAQTPREGDFRSHCARLVVS
jgi:hypothetical protein